MSVPITCALIVWSWSMIPFTKARRAMNVDDYETWQRGGVSPTLNAFDNATETRATVVVAGEAPVYSFKPGQSEAAGGPFITEGVVPTLQAQNNGSTAVPAVSFAPATNATCVRRLTPIECERLQGFPDNWTEGLADTHRYKQMGNAVTVNVAHYIGWLLADA